MSFDLISIGDSTIDVFLEIEEASVNCEIDPEECKLVIDYADKIPVTKLTRIAAVGNAANNAIGSSRLGLEVALFTKVGEDSEGEEMKKIFDDEKVAGDYIVTDKGKRSNFSAVINFKGERTILVYHEARRYDLPKMDKTKWVYFTSIGKGHEILHEQIPAYIKESGAKLAFQPGSHQIREGKEVFRPLLDIAEVILINKREAEEILGKQGEISELLKKIGDLGPKTVVITDGKDGSWTYDGDKVRFCPIFPESEMVERTGAGDAYSTGFVAGMILNIGVEEAMRWGSVNGASVVEHIGAREGLLTRVAMEERVAKNPEIKVEER